MRLDFKLFIHIVEYDVIFGQWSQVIKIGSVRPHIVTDLSLCAMKVVEWDFLQ